MNQNWIRLDGWLLFEPTSVCLGRKKNTYYTLFQLIYLNKLDIHPIVILVHSLIRINLMLFVKSMKVLYKVTCIWFRSYVMSCHFYDLFAQFRLVYIEKAKYHFKFDK